jgi:hypothetical protein
VETKYEDFFNTTDSFIERCKDEDYHPLILDLRDGTTRQIPIVEIMMKGWQGGMV